MRTWRPGILLASLLLCGFDSDPCAGVADSQRCQLARDTYDACHYEKAQRSEFTGYTIREKCQEAKYCGKQDSKECRDIPFRTCREEKTPTFRDIPSPDVRRCMTERGFGAYLPLFVQ